MLNPVQSGDQQADREEIDQVRVLLFGDIQRENEQRFAALEAQLRDLRQTLERKLSAMASEQAQTQAELIRSIGGAIAELGNHISQMAGPATHDASDHE